MLCFDNDTRGEGAPRLQKLGMSKLSGQTSVIHLCMVQLKPEKKQTENLRSTYGLNDLLQVSAGRVKVLQLLSKYSDIYRQSAPSKSYILHHPD